MRLDFRRIALFLILGLAILAVSYLTVTAFFAPAPRGGGVEELTEYYDWRIPTLMQRYSVPGISIALIHEGKMVWTNAYGYADLAMKRKMTTDTYFRVESISKSVTAWGVMRLVERGRVDLDKPVTNYITSLSFPESKYPLQNITVRHLLSNIAGFPIGDFMEQYPPTDKVPGIRENLSAEAYLVQAPGESFLYSNVGFNVLEVLIEDVTGENFASYMATNVMEPLGMNGATFAWSEHIAPLPSIGYNSRGKAVPVYVYPGKGSGGLFASVKDVAAFVVAGMKENPVLSLDMVKEIYSSSVAIDSVYKAVAPWYGFGHFVERLPDGKMAVWHGGQGNGLMTHFHSVPETGDGIVLLVNSQRSWPLIAYLLQDWARWSEFSSIGMYNIIRAKLVLQTMIGLIMLISLWQLSRLLSAIISRERRLVSQKKDLHVRNFIQLVLGLFILGGLQWATQQDYLFITSVFPIRSLWLGGSLFVLSLLLLLSGLFVPRKTDQVVVI